MKRTMLVATAALSMGLAACGGRHSAAGFRLPETGSPAAGEAAFVELGCQRCHSVDGVDLPAATAQSALRVKLGGALPEVRTDGYLVTSILHPSHRLAGYPKDEVSIDGESRMPDFTRRMTVRQMIDIVAFLQEHYELSPPTGIHP